MATIKRTLSRVQDVPEEILACVKKIRKGAEAEKFGLSNCCHTVNISIFIIYIIKQTGQLYTHRAVRYYAWHSFCNIIMPFAFQENITQLLGKYYTTKARFPMDFPDKQVNDGISIYRLFGDAFKNSNKCIKI